MSCIESEVHRNNFWKSYSSGMLPEKGDRILLSLFLDKCVLYASSMLIRNL